MLLLYRDGRRSDPVRLFPELTDVSDPAVSRDGSRLDFTRACWTGGKRSDQDLRIASWNGATYVDPRPIGPEINSGAEEMGASFGPGWIPLVLVDTSWRAWERRSVESGAVRRWI